jgi:hypothetical protein
VNPRPMRSARILTVVLGLAGVALVVLAGTRTWAHVTVLDLPGMTDVALGGRQAAPAVVPVALACGAAVVVLTLAGRVVRLLVALGLVGLGALVVSLTLAARDDAAGALVRSLRTGVGMFGGAVSVGVPQGLDADQTRTVLTGWPWLAVAGGVLLAVAGLVALLTGWAWPGPARRFEAPGAAATPVPVPGGSADRGSAPMDDAWDSLSRGDDPT